MINPFEPRKLNAHQQKQLKIVRDKFIELHDIITNIPYDDNNGYMKNSLRSLYESSFWCTRYIAFQSDYVDEPELHEDWGNRDD